MVLSLALVLFGISRQVATRPITWYGPSKATFRVVFDGDPYDPDQNDVKIKFTGEHGETYERLGYFDGASFSAVLVAPTAGKYKAALYRNGKLVDGAVADGPTVLSAPLPKGFVRCDPTYPNRFKWDNGEPYYPVGIDLGWKAGAVTLPDQIKKIGAAGGNWARIWACPWDGKNPWFPQDDARAVKNQMWLPALQQWAGIVSDCDVANLPFQFVLFHHGLVSSTTDSNWSQNPWNAANGGFLKDPSDFFTDKEAIRREKMWLRYAVARYGSSPSVLSWELFNEVQWVDAMKNRVPDVCAWHKQMADYLRSIDPYHHLVTSSSTLEYPAMLAPLDYLQPHTYPTDILSSIVGTPVPSGKPLFYGEFGPSGSQDARQAMRDGMYAGMLANQAGSGQYWYWDIVEKQNLYSEITKGQHVVTLSELPRHPNAQPSHVKVSSPVHAELVFRPGGGFEKARKLSFNLPDEATSKDLGGLPSFIQGSGHRDMFPSPLELKFSVTKLGKMRIVIGNYAKSGAQILVEEGGMVLASKSFPASDKDQTVNTTIEIPIHPGQHSLKISNPGADWFTLSGITIPDIGDPARVTALEDTTWLMARLTAVEGVSTPVALTLTGVALQNGTYQATWIDLDTGQDHPFTVEVKNYTLSPLNLEFKDAILVMKK